MATTAAEEHRVSQPEIGWDRLNKTKFYVIGAGLFSGVSTLLYPISVVKTRMQVATKGQMNISGPAVFKGILRQDGIPGLYRGFGTVIVGTIPSRMVLLTSLETTKLAALNMTEKLKISEATRAALANGIAGLVSSLLSQAIFVPIDVVSQRLMIQGTPEATKYSGGFDVVRKILKTDGIRGLYRGFGMSVITYSPSSAVWWASYGASQRLIWNGLGQWTNVGEQEKPKQWQVVSVQAAGGIVSGSVVSIATTPLDTIKTRLQVIDTVEKPTIYSTAKTLLKEDGPKGFYRGLGPRFLSISAWGTCMIVSYEFLKRLSVNPEP
ncbi:hypothetical protein GOP47_0011274 [Adiantum capillus-veneris]|uniref:Mitochondrial carrier protein n=1 Tax=Adiantum capillus-veneris TaxID=13818 RepID=A0A9D4USZ3_ADICA|nr:hypothetical protein GOP47_0011274 [Adiantum capillus-veneris]